MPTPPTFLQRRPAKYSSHPIHSSVCGQIRKVPFTCLDSTLAFEIQITCLVHASMTLVVPHSLQVGLRPDSQNGLVLSTADSPFWSAWEEVTTRIASQFRIDVLLTWTIGWTILTLNSYGLPPFEVEGDHRGALKPSRGPRDASMEAMDRKSLSGCPKGTCCDCGRDLQSSWRSHSVILVCNPWQRYVKYAQVWFYLCAQLVNMCDAIHPTPH